MRMVNKESLRLRERRMREIVVQKERVGTAAPIIEWTRSSIVCFGSEADVPSTFEDSDEVLLLEGASPPIVIGPNVGSVVGQRHSARRERP